MHQMVGRELEIVIYQALKGWTDAVNAHIEKLALSLGKTAYQLNVSPIGRFKEITPREFDGDSMTKILRTKIPTALEEASAETMINLAKVIVILIKNDKFTPERAVLILDITALIKQIPEDTVDSLVNIVLLSR